VVFAKDCGEEKKKEERLKGKLKKNLVGREGKKTT